MDFSMCACLTAFLVDSRTRETYLLKLVDLNVGAIYEVKDF